MNVGEFKQWCIDNAVEDGAEMHVGAWEIQGGMAYPTGHSREVSFLVAAREYRDVVGKPGHVTEVDRVMMFDA